ncbi:hypothetical protein HDU96_007760 [Phlyctochytrium bullatum]|nr:hypothetical protein HDU96_007760 [Phlyctochytrium bullatum]
MLFSLRAAATVAIAAISLALVSAQDAFDYPYGNSDVSVVSTIDERREISYNEGFTLVDYNITVQLAVKNKAQVKEVGIRYTNQSGSNFYEAPASYVKNLDKGYELWSLLLQRGAHWTDKPIPEYEVTGYVSYNKGQRSWDPRNSCVYNKATAKQPALLLSDSISYKAATNQAVLQGSIRTFSINRDADYKTGNVIVRWSIDNGKTQTDTSAVPNVKDDTWSWSFPVAKVDLSIPADVTYLILFKPAGSAKDFLANNKSNQTSFSKILRPTYTIQDAQEIIGTSSSDVNGITIVNVNAKSDLPLGDPSARIDGDAYKVLSQKFEPTVRPQNGLEIQAFKLSNGAHTYEFKVPVLGGPDVLTGKVSFNVKNKLKNVGTWFPAPAAGYERTAAWALAPAANGKILIGWDRGYIGLYSKFGTKNAPEVVYKVPDQSSTDYFFNVGTTATKVYGLTSSSRLYRWHLNGTLDTTFGGSRRGFISLETNAGPFGTASICFASGLVVLPNALVVTDSCNKRVLRFDVDGKFTHELLLGRNSATAGIDLRTGDVVTVSFANDASNSPALITADAAKLGVKSYVDVKPGFSSFDAIVVTKKGTLVSTNYNGVSYFGAADGAFKGAWTGVGLYNTPGSLYVARTPVVLGNGDVGVLSVEQAAVQVFSEDVVA